MKLTIFTKKSHITQERGYERAAKELGVELTNILYRNVEYHNGVFTHKGDPIPNSDCFVLAEYQKRNSLVNALANNIIGRNLGYLLNQGNFRSMAGNYDKLQQAIAFDKAGVPAPETHYLLVKKQEVAQDWIGYVAKPLAGSQGKGVELVTENTQLPKGPILFQKAIKSSYDVRVIILNGEILGAMKRQNNEKFINNFSTGGSVSAYELSESQTEVALKAAASLQLDYCGVDLMTDEESGQTFVLEVNRGAQFKGFEQVHENVKVPERIINFLQTKTE